MEGCQHVERGFNLATATLKGRTTLGKRETVLTPGHKAATQNNDVLVDLWGSLDGQAKK